MSLPTRSSQFPTLSVAQTRELDRLTIEEVGLPGIVLMENAARAATDIALALAQAKNLANVVVLVGVGNNGGDGLAMARLLDSAGLNVTIRTFSDPNNFKGDALINWCVIEALGLEAKPWANQADFGPDVLVIDALFGTGLKRPVTGTYAEAIERLNLSQATVVSVDIPSGIQGDSGEVMGIAVKAHTTVTFAATKTGLVTSGAENHVGELHVVDIGIPRQIYARVKPDARQS